MSTKEVTPERLIAAADRLLSTGCRYPIAYNDTQIHAPQDPDFTLAEWNEGHNFLVRLGMHKGPLIKGGTEK